MIPESLSPIANHLWQSTLVAGITGIVTLALRKNSARVRHWVWVAASLKFLIPFSVLVAIGGRLEWRTAPAIAPNVIVVVEQVSRPFTLTADSSLVLATAPKAPGKLPGILFGIWACGFIGISVSWWTRWWRIRSAVRAGSLVEIDIPIRAISSPSFIEPGVFGIFRPVLLLPEGIFEHLTPDQWRSVLAHELCHVRHRDNLVAVVRMFVETAFWFYPLVWWIGRRIFEERERACDEEVLRLGGEPRTYAQGILKVCELYLASPVAFMAGVSGSNLGKRIEEIMSNCVVHKMDLGRKLLLAATGSLVVAAPMIIGVLNAPLIRAQSQPSPEVMSADATPMFEVATIKPSKPGDDEVYIRVNPSGVVNTKDTSLGHLIRFAYSLHPRQIIGGPSWLETQKYDVTGKSDKPGMPSGAQLKAMIQKLLADRFQLTIHREKRELSAYAITVARSGAKLIRNGRDPDGHYSFSVTGGRLSLTNGTVAEFASVLQGNILDRPVVDQTALGSARYDFILNWTPDGPNGASPPNDADAPPDLFAALQQQLGLKLEQTKAPVEVVVVDHVERPSEN